MLGGGLVGGSVTLLGGEPGIGKSTLLLQALVHMAEAGARVLLVTAEESKEQVRLRAERLGALHPGVLIVAADLAARKCSTHVADVDPDVLAVDSIQTVADPEVPGAPGSVSQVRECAHRLVRLAKDRNLPTLLVGHVTKEGSIAGPRALEHIVDTVLAFEGDRHHALRMLHALKHRFGSTHELGLFAMEEAGLVDVLGPVEPLPRRPAHRPARLGRHRGARRRAAGARRGAGAGHPDARADAPALGPGARPEPAHAAARGARSARRAAASPTPTCTRASPAGSGSPRPAPTSRSRSRSPARVRGRPVAADLVAVGEIGLGGEVRQAAQTPRRLAEAARLGFRRAIVPDLGRRHRRTSSWSAWRRCAKRCARPGSTRTPARRIQRRRSDQSGSPLALLS